MAYAKVVFENSNTGQVKEAPVGFSWTVLFFGFCPPLFRSDWKWAVIILLLHLLTWGLSSIVFSFIYNNLYMKDLIGSGFKAKSIDTGNIDDVSQKLGVNIPLLQTS